MLRWWLDGKKLIRCRKRRGRCRGSNHRGRRRKRRGGEAPGPRVSGGLGGGRCSRQTVASPRRCCRRKIGRRGLRAAGCCGHGGGRGERRGRPAGLEAKCPRQWNRGGRTPCCRSLPCLLDTVPPLKFVVLVRASARADRVDRQLGTLVFRYRNGSRTNREDTGGIPTHLLMFVMAVQSCLAEGIKVEVSSRTRLDRKTL